MLTNHPGTTEVHLRLVKPGRSVEIRLDPAYVEPHEVVAGAVKLGLQRGVDLSELPLEVLKQFHAAIGDDVFAALSLRGSLDARQVAGGTAPVRVREQIAAHRARLAP